ncbi:MAG: class I mannose-6-phosphate isomerase [Nakamurella sp.]
MTGQVDLSSCTPTVLGPNQFPHFYRGGAAIQRLRGLSGNATTMPEDWVGSTTSRFGTAMDGLSALPGGRLLRDAIAADPVGWLGSQHVDALGPDLGLLVKLLDAGQRLVVHSYPDQAFASRHLGCRHGKTEAWIVLEADRSDPLVYLGFRETVAADTMRTWVADQNIPAMLTALNAVPISPGDAILVPAGLPHAIGAGTLIVELQEPTDFSVVLEWKGFDLDGPADGHLGLGYELALQCVDRSGWTADRLTALRGPADDGSARMSLLPPEADPFFRAERVRGGAELGASVAVLVATSGHGLLRTGNGGSLPLRRGQTAIVPYAAGRTAVEGPLELIRCLPTDPAVQPNPAVLPAGNSDLKGV